MKRKFRGYDIIGHKWVYGDLEHNQKVTETGLEPRVMVGGYEVDPGSVGAFTGKFDIHQKEVYEGDITKVKIHGGDIAVAVVTYDEEMCAFLHDVKGEGFFCMSGACEIIGNIMDKNIDALKVREQMSVTEPEIRKLEVDPSLGEPERCCGACCWMQFEDTDGWGYCSQVAGGEHSGVCHCSDLCTVGRYVSEHEKRHHMAVLIQANRYRRDQHVPSIYRMPDPKELGKAIDFAVRYMKVL